jgi:anti-sigma regulatory factor (Ser/Thr protein kinase)
MSDLDAFVMNSESANSAAESLILESRLSEISRIQPWIEELASLHAIPDRTCYAMNLCLEEVVSNIVRHGHSSESSDPVKVNFQPHRGGFYALVVEDTAPPFNPLLVPDPHAPRSLDEMSGGGQGIHLLKQFADEIEYQGLPNGNRLIISFIFSSETPRRKNIHA